MGFFDEVEVERPRGIGLRLGHEVGDETALQAARLPSGTDQLQRRAAHRVARPAEHAPVDETAHVERGGLDRGLRDRGIERVVARVTDARGIEQVLVGHDTEWADGA